VALQPYVRKRESVRNGHPCFTTVTDASALRRLSVGCLARRRAARTYYSTVAKQRDGSIAYLDHRERQTSEDSNIQAFKLKLNLKVQSATGRQQNLATHVTSHFLMMTFNFLEILEPLDCLYKLAIS